MKETASKQNLESPACIYKTLYQNPSKGNQLPPHIPQIDTDPFDRKPFLQYFDFPSTNNNSPPLFYNPNFQLRKLFGDNSFLHIYQLKRAFSSETLGDLETPLLFKFGDLFWEEIFRFLGLDTDDLLSVSFTSRYLYILVQSYLSVRYFRVIGEFPPVLYSPYRFCEFLGYSTNTLTNLHYMLVYAINHNLMTFITKYFEKNVENIYRPLLEEVNQALNEDKQTSINVEKSVSMIIKELVNINQNVSNRNMRPIITAICSNNYIIVQKLIDLGSILHPNLLNYDGFNALQIAVIFHNYEICNIIVNYIIQHNQSISEYDEKCDIFKVCVKYTGKKIVKLLIKIYSSKLSDSNQYQLAIKGGIFEAIKLRKSKIAITMMKANTKWLKINKLTSNSKTILMYAAKYNDKLVIEYILTEWKHEKVDLNIESKSRNTAIHYAVKHGSESLVEFLIEKGSNTNRINGKGKSPFFIGIERGSIPMIMLLLPHTGAQTLETLDTRGIHPLTMLRWKLSKSHSALLSDIRQYCSRLSASRKSAIFMGGDHAKMMNSQINITPNKSDNNLPPDYLLNLHRKVVAPIRKKISIDVFYLYKFSELRNKLERRVSICEGVLYKEKRDNRYKNIEQIYTSHSAHSIPNSHWIKYDIDSALLLTSEQIKAYNITNYALFRLFRLNILKVKRAQIKYTLTQEKKLEISEKSNSKENIEESKPSVKKPREYFTIDNSELKHEYLNIVNGGRKIYLLKPDMTKFNLEKKILFSGKISEGKKLLHKITQTPHIEFINTKLSPNIITRKIKSNKKILETMIKLSEKTPDNFIFLYPVLEQRIVADFLAYSGLKIKSSLHPPKPPILMRQSSKYKRFPYKPPTAPSSLSPGNIHPKQQKRLGRNIQLKKSSTIRLSKTKHQPKIKEQNLCNKKQNAGKTESSSIIEEKSVQNGKQKQKQRLLRTSTLQYFPKPLAKSRSIKLQPIEEHLSPKNPKFLIKKFTMAVNTQKNKKDVGQNTSRTSFSSRSSVISQGNVEESVQKWSEIKETQNLISINISPRVHEEQDPVASDLCITQRGNENPKVQKSKFGIENNNSSFNSFSSLSESLTAFDPPPPLPDQEILTSPRIPNDLAAKETLISPPLIVPPPDLSDLSDGPLQIIPLSSIETFKINEINYDTNKLQKSEEVRSSPTKPEIQTVKDTKEVNICPIEIPKSPNEINIENNIENNIKNNIEQNIEQNIKNNIENNIKPISTSQPIKERETNIDQEYTKPTKLSKTYKRPLTSNYNLFMQEWPSQNKPPTVPGTSHRPNNGLYISNYSKYKTRNSRPSTPYKHSMLSPKYKITSLSAAHSPNTKIFRDNYDSLRENNESLEVDTYTYRKYTYTPKLLIKHSSDKDLHWSKRKMIDDKKDLNLESESIYSPKLNKLFQEEHIQKIRNTAEYYKSKGVISSNPQKERMLRIEVEPDSNTKRVLDLPTSIHENIDNTSRPLTPRDYSEKYTNLLVKNLTERPSSGGQIKVTKLEKFRIEVRNYTHLRNSRNNKMSGTKFLNTWDRSPKAVFTDYGNQNSKRYSNSPQLNILQFNYIINNRET